MPELSAPTPSAVFVYGTLRPGYGNHRWCVGDLPHRVRPGTLDGFALVGHGRAFPYAVARPGSVTVGDVLSFDSSYWPDALRAMDRLEGYPVHYGRRVVDVVLADGATVKAWVYTPDHDRHDGLRPVPGGDWSNSSRRSGPVALVGDLWLPHLDLDLDDEEVDA